jgi:hypothetical protein
MRLDEEKLEALRTWGDRLRQSAGEESSAVGRAILMLVEEIDRLHIDLWHAQMERVSADVTREGEEEPVASSLHERLQRVLRRAPGPAAEFAEESGPETETDMSTSPQAWIAAMRRKT